jgi:sialate O-acetylesterase
MLDNAFFRSVITIFVLIIISGSGRADVRLPKVIGDHMVLQRDKPLRIWGWADPEEKVTVSMGDHAASAVADAAGGWSVHLPAMSAGGPFKLVVQGKNKIELEDILVGEVWVCSGQSNMQWPMSATHRAGQDIPKANHPKIRLFSVPAVSNGRPQQDIKAQWTACTPAAVRDFSAVAYYFGKELHEDLNVPVGLINSSWGGTAIEPWTPPIGFKMNPFLKVELGQIERAKETYRKDMRKHVEAIDAWLKVSPQWIAKARKAADGDEDLPEMPKLEQPAHPLSGSSQPSAIYNSMIHPLVPFAIRGAIWYQGESNNGQGMMYHEKMKALVNGWRTVWGQGDFPFLFVQIAPFSGYSDGAIEGIWEAQLASLSIPNTGMAVTTDLVSNIRDIHPNNKADVAHRLVLWAKAKTYGQKDLIHSGPLFKSSSREGNTIRVRFDHVGGGLTTRDGKEPNSFLIGTSAGFMPAQARIDGDSVVVWNDAVPKPEAVRFGWSKTTNPNLMNKEGLPASPFRTDCGQFAFSIGSRFIDRKLVEISAGPHKGTIRYTLDGSMPDEKSETYSGPITLKDTATVSARLFGDDGRASIVASAKYSRIEPVIWEGKKLIEGVRYRLYEGDWTALPDYEKLNPVEEGELDAMSLAPAGTRFTYGMRFNAFLDVPQDGEYTFYLTSDDGSKLLIDGKAIVDNDGIHPPTELRGEKVRLTRGKHSLEINYFQRGGQAVVALAWDGPDLPKQPVPSSKLLRTEISR